MATFKIKEVEKVKTAHIYEIEAESEEEAIRLYSEELAGSLEELDSYFVDSEDEGVTIIKVKPLPK